MAREEAMATPGYDYDKDIPAGFYDEIHQRKAGVRFFWHDLKFRAVAAHLKGAGRVLDIGCGPGTFIGNYLDGVECLGIDVSAPQIDYANRRYATPRHRFSTEAVASLDQRFDAITLIEVIEHLPPEEARWLLVEARGLLSAEGRLVVTTPNYRSLWPLIEWGVNRVSRVGYEQQHINKYERGRLAAELAQAGYGTVEIATAVGLAPFAAVLGRRPAEWLDAIERGVGHLGCGNLLLAVARP
ncbi:MAG: class I SAM-dependent methyltransferase [Reyranella sp.]|jgi:2-polyprenyl-3-methyl-5-hydroxy-6-metoxy-1,4-benzoquinol methylase|nr:class I SAM-dependent methyltransferase [Reyranella sp.]MBL6651908.1 class I SAM-dependent methyltransferase [Reyranella sp.]